MADKGGANRTSRHDWGWIPSQRYGPFIFGATLADVPHLDPEVERADMGDSQASTHDSEFDDISLSFWDGQLVGVGCDETFVLNSTELIGTHFNDVRDLFAGEPAIKNYDPLIMVAFDDLDLLMFLDMGWIITSVSVSVDPDRLNS